MDDSGTDAGAHSKSGAARRLLARHFLGSGVELGPGHAPFALPLPGVQVRYVDRWRPDDNRSLFPELSDADFPEPDIVANFDTDRLLALPDSSQDFVICSHVLEHLAEPIGFLAEIHRVLRSGGVAVIFLPDRHQTFDRLRQPTSLDHLAADFEKGETRVDDDHLLEFLEMTGAPLEGLPEQHVEYLELHRKRSIHVHCWDDEEFHSVLLYTMDRLGQRWEFVDGAVSDDLGQEGGEFGFVLRRSDSNVSTDVLARRFEMSWLAWRDSRITLLRARNALEHTQLEMSKLTEQQSVLISRQAWLDRIEGAAPFRVYRVAKRVVRRLDRRIRGGAELPSLSGASHRPNH
jgi:SAM-dependent methyltransferase